MSSNNMRGDLILRDISTGQTFVLKSNVRTYVCGRAKNADINTTSILASREHCHFTRIRGELNVADVGSSNGIYINGVHKTAHTMILLKINDLIGIGCAEVTPTRASPAQPAASNGDGPDRFIKTIYRLEFPPIERTSENNVPTDGEQRAMEVCAKSPVEKRRLSKDCFDTKLCKKLKTDEMLPDVIDLTDNSNDGISVPSSSWHRPSAAPNPFTDADLSAIKFESFGAASTSRDRDSSSRGIVNGHDASLATGKTTIVTRDEEKKSPDDDQNRGRDRARDARSDDQLSNGPTKRRKFSSDTDSTRDDRHRDKTKSLPIPTSPPNNRVGDTNLASSAKESSRRTKQITNRRDERTELDSHKKINGLPSASIKDSNFLVSPNECSRRAEQVVPTRRSGADSSSEDEIDILKREDFVEPDDTSHSSWENVEDFSIPGYNADETEFPEVTNIVVPASTNGVDDQQIKYEPELHIVDNDESIYMDVNHASQTFTPTPLKLKRVVKQEPVTEYSQHDFVEWSDNEEDVFPASQLFGDDEGIESEKKIKHENEFSDEENEREVYDRRDNDSPLLIQLSDSEEEVENNPWYDRLMKAELNASQEYDMQERDRTKLEEAGSRVSNGEDTPLLPMEEDAPMSFAVDDSPMSPPEVDAPIYPPKNKVPMCLPEKDGSISPVDRNVPPSSPECDDRMSSPELDSPMSPPEQNDCMLPSKATLAAHDGAESPILDVETEIFEVVFAPGEDKTDKTATDKKKHTSRKERAERYEKMSKLNEEKAIQESVREKEKSREDVSSSSKKKSPVVKKNKKHSHHHKKQKSVDRLEDSEDSEANIAKKSKSHKHDDEKRRRSSEAKAAGVADSREKKRDSTEEKSNLRTKAAHLFDSNKKRESTEDTSCDRTKVTHVVDGSNKKRDFTEDKSSNRTKVTHVSEGSNKKRDSTEEKSCLRSKSASTADSTCKKRDLIEAESNVRTKSASTAVSSSKKRDLIGEESHVRTKSASPADSSSKKRDLIEGESNVRSKSASTADSRNKKRDLIEEESNVRPKSASTADGSGKKRDLIEEESNVRPKSASTADGSGKKRDHTKEEPNVRTKSTSTADSSSKKRDLIEGESNVRPKSASTADSSSKKRVSPEHKSNLRTETTSIVDNETEPQSPEGRWKQRAETPSRTMPNGVPVVVLTKVDHVRKSVPIVEAPIMGCNQRRGFSVQVIDKSGNNTDYQTPSTSGTQITNSNKTAPPKMRRLTTKQKRDLEFERKVLEKKRRKDDKNRRMNNKWADIPSGRRSVVISPLMSQEQIHLIKIDRKEKLREIADKQNEAADANAAPVKRPVKAKAKVTQKTRNDFLVDELDDQPTKATTNVERTSVNNSDKIPVATKGKDESTDLRKQTATKASSSESTANVTERTDETTHLRKQTLTHDEIPPITESYDDYSEHETDIASPPLERESITNGVAYPANGEHSPKGNKRRDKYLDSITGRTTNSMISLHNGANFYRENNERESEVASSHAEKRNGDKSPRKTKRNSPGAGDREGKENADGVFGPNANLSKNVSRSVESGLLYDPRREAALNNGYAEKSAMQGVQRGTTTQNDRQWYDKTNGTTTVEESGPGCRRTLNNNVIYEKEPTIASRDPRLKTGKPVKLKSLLKKPRRSIASKPRAIKRVTFDDRNTKIQLFEIDPGNSLRKCDFKGKDSPLAIKQNSPTNFKNPVAVDCPKLEEFLLRIFEWNPVWLKEQKTMNRPPPVVKENSLVRMLPRYETYKAYYDVAEPLMALELWYGISKDYDDREQERGAKTSCMFSVVDNSVTRITVPSTTVNVTTLQIEIVVSRRELQERTHPTPGDLIFFEYASIRGKSGGSQRWNVFGYVTKLHQCILTPHTLYNCNLAKFVSDPYMLLTLSVMTKPLNPMEMQTNTINRLGTISYLRSNIRTIQALQNLPNSTLSGMILNPKVEDYQLPRVANLESYPLVTKDKLNLKQLEAVARVTEAVVQKLPKICLIQGPPGTGKSKVIVNMMMQILYGRARNYNRKGMRILVCAPSNAAIDEIVLRLLDIRRTFEKGNRFNMVRIGRDHAMHPMVKEVSLKELAKKNVKVTADTYKSPEFTPECVQEEKNRLEARKNSLELELATARNLDAARVKQLKNKLSDIEASYALLISGRSVEHLDGKEALKLQRGAENTLLKGADVIACTLSSCYTDMMQSIFAGTDQTISVCIVDEATQSIEAETLVPLMLGVKTLVLVGDTNQLPATVLSQRAKMLGLDQSLFARIQRSFDGHENNPIILLDTQYRMSYPVAYWPNRYFYAGALKNSENMRNIPSNFYKVIDLDSTQDINKFTNTNEAHFVATLVYTIMARSTWDNSFQQVRIGIITPYNNQKTLITSKIRERTAMLSEKTKKRFVHEVNTVDSFQGQERDIIIMSCVRSNGIGFLADRQRLCVAMTRAKHSLIMCGNFGAFKANPMWNALLTDAKGRGVYLKMRASAEVDEIMKNIFR